MRMVWIDSREDSREHYDIRRDARSEFDATLGWTPPMNKEPALVSKKSNGPSH
jgi:hypothetical protein